MLWPPNCHLNPFQGLVSEQRQPTSKWRAGRVLRMKSKHNFAKPPCRLHHWMSSASMPSSSATKSIKISLNRSLLHLSEEGSSKTRSRKRLARSSIKWSPKMQAKLVQAQESQMILLELLKSLPMSQIRQMPTLREQRLRRAQLMERTQMSTHLPCQCLSTSTKRTTSRQLS